MCIDSRRFPTAEVAMRGSCRTAIYSGSRGKDAASNARTARGIAEGGNDMRGVTGLHHVTAIAGPAQENLDFYAGVLGMRLVKRTVNQDDPATYHLFYADAEGRAGTDLTFFPWELPYPRRDGHGTSVEVSLAVPPSSLEFWGERLARYGARVGAVETRFGRRALPFVDPHGLRVALAADDDSL